MKKSDGGAAFPSFEHYIHEPTNKILTGEPHGGMTLRDYFAGQALSNLARYYKDGDIERICYNMADKMLKERERTDG